MAVMFHVPQSQPIEIIWFVPLVVPRKIEQGSVIAELAMLLTCASIAQSTPTYQLRKSEMEMRGLTPMSINAVVN